MNDNREKINQVENIDTQSRIYMLRFMLDIPNLMTLTGLCCGMLSIYFTSLHEYSTAMISLLWAAFFDWFDGPVAKIIKGRNKDFMTFGGQLDSIADLVSCGVAPAFILLTIGNFDSAYIPGALFLVCSGAIRLSYFNVYGLKEDGTYSGVPIGINIILITLVFLLQGTINTEYFQWLLYCVILIGGALNIAPIPFMKLTGVWYVAIACFVFLLTMFYVWRISFLG